MANGNFAGGNGSNENPFLIEDAHDLNAVRNSKKYHYKLISDIDLNLAPYNEGEGWEPIDMSYNNIYLDGGGYSVCNLYINRPNSNRVGLFAQSGRGSNYIKNLSIVNPIVIGKDYVGSFVGRVEHYLDVLRLSNISVVRGRVSGVSFVGSMAGELRAKSGNIINNGVSNCEVECLGEIEKNIGGIVGSGYSGSLTQPTIKNVLYYGKIIDKKGKSIIGNNDLDDGKIINGFFDVDVVDANDSRKDSIPLTTIQAKSPQIYIDAGWDKEITIVNEEKTPVWILEDGKYPRLWLESTPTKYLIETDKGIINMDGDIIATIDLDNQGFSLKKLQEYMNTDLNILKIYSDRNILDGTGNKILEGEILAMLDEDEKTIPIAKTDIIPKAQLIKPKGDIVFKMLNSIEEMTLFAEKGYEGVIKVIFSNDSGASWNSYTNEGLTSIDINNLIEVKEKGLSPDEFNTINKLWSSLITDDKIRFAYYLEVDSKADTALIDKLEVKTNMYGRWNKVKEGDYDYGYDNNHLYITFYKNGSYKINYQE